MSQRMPARVLPGHTGPDTFSEDTSLMRLPRWGLWPYALIASLGLILLAERLAAAAEAPVDLTLEQVLAEALAQNPTLAVERREIDIARGIRRQAGTYLSNPELEVEGGVGRGRDRVERDVRRGLDATSVGLSQPIWLQGQRGLRVRAADAGLARAAAVVEDAERQVVADVVKGYNDLLASQERLGLAREVLSLAGEVRDTAQKLFEADAAPQLDVLRAEVEVRNAENRLAAAERTLATAQHELAFLIGRPPGEPLRAVAPALLLPAPGVEPDEGRRQALDRRPDLKAAGAAVEAAKAEVDLVRAERLLPELRLGARYEEAHEFDAVTRRGLLTVSVPLPLFNRRDGDLARARAELAREQARVELVRRRIETEVSVAVQQVTASRRIVDRYVRDILPQQERNFRLLREAYEIGEIRITEVFVGQRDFIQTREAYLDAVSALNGATAELYRALNARP